MQIINILGNTYFYLILYYNKHCTINCFQSSYNGSGGILVLGFFKLKLTNIHKLVSTSFDYIHYELFYYYASTTCTRI